MSLVRRRDDEDFFLEDELPREAGPPPPPIHDDRSKGLNRGPGSLEKDHSTELEDPDDFLTSEAAATPTLGASVGTFSSLPLASPAITTSQVESYTTSKAEETSHVQPLSTPQPEVSHSGPAEDGSSHHGFDSRLVAAIVTPLLFFFGLAVLLLLFLRRRRRRCQQGLLQDDQVDEMKLEGVSCNSTPQPPPDSTPQPDPPTMTVLSRAPPASNAAYFTGIDTSDTVSIVGSRPIISAMYSDVQREEPPPPPYRPRSVAPSVPRKPVPPQGLRSLQSNEAAHRHTDMSRDSISEITSPIERRVASEGNEHDNVSVISDLSYQGEAVSPIQGV